MRWVILGLLALWGVLTAFACLVVLPDTARDQDVIRSYWTVAHENHGTDVAKCVTRFFESPEARAAGAETPGAALALDAAGQAPLLSAFRAYCERSGMDLARTPVLVWSTDDNPARRVQCALFRAWHLREFGEPVDIVPDPTNRDITKTIVQCVAGAGPDIVEAYGPAELGQMVAAGVALDVTDEAARHGFGVDSVFPAAVSSIAVEQEEHRSEQGAINTRQYAYPCNVGYTVVFYHKDLFRQAGIPEPTAPWNIEQLVAASKKLMAADPGGRRVGIMGLGAWGMALWGGNSFYNAEKTASFFNNAKTVSAFRAYQDLMYRDKVMPTPAEAASMASSGGANMNAGAESASASALFAAKVSAMVVDGRWSYVSLAQRNRDRVIRPAVERRLGELDAASTPGGARESALLRAGLESWMRDVLVPIPPEQYRAIDAALTPDDRARLIEVGVMHVPTLDASPAYEAAARVAIVNRVSPRREIALRFLRFLASPEYNNQINHTFDSICGVPRFCDAGIQGPPEPLPGLREFDSPVFVEAMEKHAFSWELSPFIGRSRLGMIAGPILEQLTNNTITPEAAAERIENAINAQIRANLIRDDELRRAWEMRAGRAFDPSKPLRDQVSPPVGARS